MRIVYRRDELPEGPVVATMGNFDGVHVGHRRALAYVRRRAEALGGFGLVLTYKPHTRLVVSPPREPFLLTTFEEKLLKLSELGVEYVVPIPFGAEMARMRAEAFVWEVLLEGWGVREVVVGYNHCFGWRAEGGPALLRELGDRMGFAVHVVGPVVAEGGVVSSTRIRRLVQEGRVEDASRLLGGPYRISGTVVHGDGRGRRIGYPTANLAVSPHKLLPSDGVYAVRVRLDGTTFPGVMNIGVRPSFGGKGRSVEVHLIGFRGELYGRKLACEVLVRLRDERPFGDVEALRDQITRDLERARAVVGR
ncbi:MAG TPA: bifunctional riboflavin kinase/FAD synthetase [Candidatus Latescibacteria bacterium]|nr:bifunctional riboflavin kinase/FAD synthetase [Candidatus Latescibacterota bacterium]